MKYKRKKLLSFLMVLFMLLGLAPSVRAAEPAAEPEEKFGTVGHYSTYGPGEVLKDSFYYSDEWLLNDDPYERNDALALTSIQLVGTAVEADPSGKSVEFLKAMGFDDIGFSGFGEDDPYGCSYTYGTKTVNDGGEDVTIVAVAVQSYSFRGSAKRLGWVQNFTVNGDVPTDEHYAFATAADSKYADIAALGGSGHVKYWIAGQSRGGAIAGMIAQRLNTAAGVPAGDIHAYTFEAPAEVESAAVPDNAGSFGFIHNYISTNDIVTMVPPWGMVRYGVDHVLNTDEADAGLFKELEGLKSAAAEKKDTPQLSPDYVSSLINALQSTVPGREEYSKLQEETLVDTKGEEVAVAYTYQDIFVKIMEMVFGEEPLGLPLDLLADKLGELGPVVASAVKGMRTGDASEMFRASEMLDDVLASIGVELPFTQGEFYGLLKLAAPLIINPDAAEEVDSENFIVFLSPALSLVDAAGMLTFSHHNDAIIARLKTLAPYPRMEGLDLAIDDPKAGDKLGKAGEQLKEKIDALDLDWLEVSAEWDTADTSLMDNKKYYLDVTFAVTAHTVPEDIMITLNEKAPADKIEISFEDGVYAVRASYGFSIGNPDKVTVSYDTAGHGQAPEDVRADRGDRLDRAVTPKELGVVKEAGREWRFDGWYDKDGNAWDSLKADEDITLYAHWKEIISDVRLLLSIPKAGDRLTPVTVNDGAVYYTAEDWFRDEHWEEVETAKEGMVITVSVKVYAADGAEFKLKLNDIGDYEFDGTVTVNGEKPADIYYDAEDGFVSVEYEFTPLSGSENETTEEITTEEVTTEEITTELPTTGEETTEAEKKPAKVDDNNSGNGQVKTGDDTDPGLLLRIIVLSMVVMGMLCVSMLASPAIDEIKKNRRNQYKQ